MNKHLQINSIVWPDEDSEFEVQAELYQQLQALGYLVRGNVKSRCSDTPKNPRVYFDLVIFDASGVALIIVECKNYKKLGLYGIAGRQMRRYNMFGVPVVLCENMEDIPKAIKTAQDFLN